MGKKKRGFSQQDSIIEEKRRKRAEEKEIIDNSPFKNIVLKEKSDTLSKNKGKINPALPKHKSSKKPHEIVQGYNPNASFADILASWETTGSPYALPDRKRAEEIKQSQTSFAEIFAAWEGKSAPMKKSEKPLKRVSEPYKPKKSFEDILNSYEGKKSVQSDSSEKVKKPKDKTPYKRSSEKYEGSVSFGEILSSYENKNSFVPSDGKQKIEKVEKATFFKEKEEDDERPSNVAWSVFGDNEKIERESEAQKAENKEKKSYKRVSPKYEPKRDFSDILKEFSENEKAPEVVTKVEKKEEKIEKPSFFKEMEEDDERPSTVAWSVFGDNKPIERKSEEVEAEKVEVEDTEYKRVSQKYEPKKDFGEILKEYAKEEKAPEIVTPAAQEEEKIEKASFFKEMDEGDERPSTVAWSIFGDNKPIERKVEAEEPKEEVPEQEKVEVVRRKEPVKSSRLFRSSVSSLESKSFEELFKEKGELEKKERRRTITELRAMLPEVFLDLHGLKQDEAEVELVNFIDEAIREGFEKISIIHGKGLHSEDGQGVLKALTLRVLESKNCVRELYAPKEQYGGEGVLWVILKKE
ncbi:MAG: Smr/MutS family protein [Sphaerochaetaceae bacterium]|nr:Smr/MutS family protein [Sphaerochaetaceae bacterium]